jgi:hypothetical protein
VCELLLRRIAVQDALRLSLPSPLIAGALVMAPEFLHVLIREASEDGVEP